MSSVEMEPLATNSFHSLESLSLEDQKLFNIFSRGSAVPIPHNIIHHAFEAIATKYPEIIAVRDYDGRKITYAELDQRANILANELLQIHCLQTGDRVLLVYSRCIEMVVFILAVLKAGGQYVPLDGAVTPEETLSHSISDSEAPVILCLPRFRTKVEKCIPDTPKGTVRVVVLDSTSSLWATGNRARPMVDVKPTDGAYVIYTSGTTGRPKGVDVRHEGVTNTLLAEPSRLGITVGSNVIQQLNVGFDMGAWEILGTIINGGTLHIRGSGDKAWADCLRRVDTVIATPSVILKHIPQQQNFSNIKTIAVGGEPCPKSLADYWAPYVDFWNVCGPTEVSMLNTAHLHKSGSTLSIGKPNPNTNVYILDEYENPVRIGEIGVMWAGGPGVSRGYLKLPELTASRYRPDKFAANGRMMYNTGDLARWLEDGNLEPLGRKDDQVKISGFRVELDGVSKSIEKYPEVTKACALKIEDKLWAFYSAPAAITEDLLRESLVGFLPFYSVPSVWRFLPTIDLTANGKVDKLRLRAIVAVEKSKVAVLVTQKELLKISPPIQQQVLQESPLVTPEYIDLPKTVARIGISDVHAGEKTLAGQQICFISAKTNIASDSDVSDFEHDKAKPEYPFPPKNGFHGWRWLRHRGLSAYRKLFGLIFIANTIPFIIMLWRSSNHNFSLPLPSLVTAVASNLLAAVLLRQDYVVNLIYYLATRFPLSTPLFIRRHFARVYHNGGVHSGCAVSAAIWWVIFAIESTRYRVTANPQPDYHYHVNNAMMVLTYLVLSLLLGILGMAYPAIRMKMHDQFEWTHRFAGWSALGLVWVHLVVATYSLQNGQKDIGSALAKTPGLYLVALTTLSIASPWLALRKVKVIAEPLSRHAVRLHFDFFTPRPSSSVGLRITDRPLVEWHAFAAIFEPGKKGFSIIVSRAGDWTGRIIDKPPTSIWTRGTPASGVLAVAPLFKKIVLVSTGSGIGPCMPVILERRVPCRILWSTKNPLKTYGQEILSNIYGTDPEAVVWDTDERGRPDLATLAYQMYRESGAECVCVVSNAHTTAKLVYRLESRGVPAFGPIWDS